MGTLGFLVNFFASLKISNITKFEREDLFTFLRGCEGNKDFRKLTTFNSEEIGSSMAIIEELNIAHKRGIFTRKCEILLNESASLKILADLSEEELNTLLMFTLKYINFLSKIEGLNVPYEVKYGPINQELVEETYGDKKTLIYKNKI